jgi:hypothetical protein
MFGWHKRAAIEIGEDAALALRLIAVDDILKCHGNE